MIQDPELTVISLAVPSIIPYFPNPYLSITEIDNQFSLGYKLPEEKEM
jgi:hypothetical protein